MDMRAGYMMRPRERCPLMRPPGFPPMRVRGGMMDRLRLPPRPPMMRGPPPPFPGRPVLPPRPRVMAPGMLPRPPMPPPGALVPPGARGLLPPPRPMLGPPPPRPIPPDLMDGYMSNIPLSNNGNANVDNDGYAGNRRNIRNNSNNNSNNQNVMQKKPNRKDNTNKNRRVPPSQVTQPPPISQAPPMQTPVQTQHTPVQNVHPGMHQIPPVPNSTMPPQQNSMHMNQPPVQKPVAPMQSQFIPSQSAPVSHQNSMRGGRNAMPQRNRGGAHVGNRGNVPMNNYAPNVPNQMPPHPNTMMNGPPIAPPQPVMQYPNAPPPSYPVPPPQVPMKRAAPPAMNAPQQPMMPPQKRVRYETPAPSNGYPCPSYQQLPQQQPTYPMNYEMPPPTSAPVQQPTDMYGNMTAPTNTNVAPVQNYNSADYGNYQMAPATSYNSNVSTPYPNTAYNTNQSYSYPSGNYDASTDYSSVPAQSMQTTDPYANYAKPVSTVDSYGYNNNSYTPQTTYEDYSSGYTDNSGYTQPVPAVNKDAEADFLMNGDALSAPNDDCGDCEEPKTNSDIKPDRSDNNMTDEVSLRIGTIKESDSCDVHDTDPSADERLNTYSLTNSQKRDFIANTIEKEKSYECTENTRPVIANTIEIFEMVIPDKTRPRKRRRRLCQKLEKLPSPSKVIANTIECTENTRPRKRRGPRKRRERLCKKLEKLPSPSKVIANTIEIEKSYERTKNTRPRRPRKKLEKLRSLSEDPQDDGNELKKLLAKKRELQNKLAKLKHCNIKVNSEKSEYKCGENTGTSSSNEKDLNISTMKQESSQRSLPCDKVQSSYLGPNYGNEIDSVEMEKDFKTSSFSVKEESYQEKMNIDVDLPTSDLPLRRENFHEFDCECSACLIEHTSLLRNLHHTLLMMDSENEM